MNNNIILLILCILVLCYSFFSATETAFSLSNRLKIKTLARKGNAKANRCIKLFDNYSKLLTTVLIGNTIVNVSAASLATVLFTNIYHDNGVAISSVVMTIVIMVIGEIIPKNMASSNPEEFSMNISSIINIIIIIFTPLTFVFNNIEKLIKKEEKENNIQEEFLTMVEEAKEEDHIEDNEADIISNAIEFNDIDVGEIYTPRIDVIAVDIDTCSIQDIEKMFRESGYSRLPVYRDNLDNIIGLLLEKDFYYHFYYKKDIKCIESILKEVIYTSWQVRSSSLLKRFQETKTHMAIVTDEYGGTDGIVTLEDILEELVGEIYDEHDKIEHLFNKINDKEYIVKGDVEIEDFYNYFNINDPVEEEFNTLSGFLIDKFDRIPFVGDKIDYNNLLFEVIKADKKKIIEVKVYVK